MNSMLRKHWTSLLGVLFVLTAFVTLFRYTAQEGWLTDTMKIGLGLLCGAGLASGGLGAAMKRRRSPANAAPTAQQPREALAAASEIAIGLGACVLYATFSFAGIYYDLWTPMTVLLGMTVVTALLAWYSYRFESRLLMNIALAGGLLAPMLMRPETDQVFTLFLYLFIVNAAFFAISIARRWSELRIVAFAGSWLLYAVYFAQFHPELEGLWSRPIRYAVAAFAFYAIGFLFASWRDNRCFDGSNLYLSLTNGILFGCWAIYILNGDLHYGFTLGALGAAYAAVGWLVRRLTGRIGMYAATHGGGGLLLLLIAVAQTGNGTEARPLIVVYLWTGIAAALAAVGRRQRMQLAEGASSLVWLVVGLYWFAVTWNAPRGEWFGVYLPLLNWAAIAWMLVAALGFYYSVRLASPRDGEWGSRALGNVCALLSHLVVGGLLTLQLVNVFDVYFPNASGSALQLSLSVSWGIYALLLFLWGGYQRQKLFRWFGSFVLAGVAVKAIFLDLSGREMLYKAAVLLALGGISFLITWVNGKWSAGREEAAAESETAAE